MRRRRRRRRRMENEGKDLSCVGDDMENYKDWQWPSDGECLWIKMMKKMTLMMMTMMTMTTKTTSSASGSDVSLHHFVDK